MMDELTKLLKKLCKQHGFLDTEELAELARLDRLRSVLVRCGNGRFTCAAQDAKHFIDLIKHGEHIRDVALLASDAAFEGHYHSYTEFYHRKFVTRQSVVRQSNYTVDRADYGGAFDGFTVSSDADSGL
jgi:hypothetical protein